MTARSINLISTESGILQASQDDATSSINSHADSSVETTIFYVRLNMQDWEKRLALGICVIHTWRHIQEDKPKNQIGNLFAMGVWVR